MNDPNPPQPAPPAQPANYLRSDEMFRRIVQDTSDYAIFLLDPTGHVASWNRGGERIVGYAAHEIIGRHFSVFYPRAAAESGWPDHELSEATRVGRFEDEGWRVRNDGALFWANVIITALRGEDGKLLAFSKVVRDLSGRRAAEERLRESEERQRLIIEGVQDYAIFMLDTGGHVKSWNEGARRIKGYSAEEIVGRHFSVFYPEEQRRSGWPAKELAEAARLGRFEDEGWRVTKDGSTFWANVIITALRDENGVLRGFSKITRDLTERRAHEERLRESEERFRLLLEGIEDYAIFMLDPAGRLTSWNRGGERMTGFEAGELLGHSFERLYAPSGEEDEREPADDLRQATLNRRIETRGWRLRKDGSRFWAETVIAALRDTAGHLRGFALVMRDLSERKRTEKLEEEGRRLTEFLAMLAHELRNPLAPIRNAVAIMGVGGDLPARAAWCRDVIDRQATQLGRLVDDLLDVSRVTRGKLRLQAGTMDLEAAVQRALEASRPLIEARGQTLEVVSSAQPLVLNGDLTRLAQVVVNVLNNAAKYTPEGGHIRLTTTAEGADAVLRVRDNGMGIPKAMLDTVFDLFAQGERTLDRSEGGLGIGLTLARRIVELHGGRIIARSDGPGQGSEFEIRLPRLHAQAPSEDPVKGKLAVSERGRSILLVEDNADAAQSMAVLLQMMGHAVRIEHEGPAALARAAAEPVDIVMLDIGLPGMNGYQVARALRELPRGHAFRIYALTGYGQEEDRRRSAEAGIDGHLVKPVLPADLLALIESSDAAV